MIASGRMSGLEKPARVRFREIARRSDRDLPLALGALLIAAEEYEELDVDLWLDRLDELAGEARPLLARARPGVARLEALARYLHIDRGFRGNAQDYYDPRNSFLNEVLERRLGIPISLSVVYLEVAARVGVPLAGVGFPAHFLLRHLGSPQVYIDPFHGGRLLAERELPRLLSSLTGGGVRFHPSQIEPISARAILTRMLTNLKGIYVGRADWLRAIEAIDRILLLSPSRFEEHRDRGMLYLRLGATGPAISDLELYLARGAKSEERAGLERILREAKKKKDTVH
jgi:regulator of sirC expression with transglutaminase-like and TPR domain